MEYLQRGWHEERWWGPVVCVALFPIEDSQRRKEGDAAVEANKNGQELGFFGLALAILGYCADLAGALYEPSPLLRILVASRP